jgi:hypothetical protein
MRKIYLALSLTLPLVLAAAAAPALAADVGVSVSVNQPGIYGRIDIGQAPVPPVVVYRQPMIIAPAPVAVQAPPPIYLHVPPGHSRNWRKYCGRYNACGQPVYFVREDWYQRHYHRHDDRHDRHDDRDDRGHHDDHRHGGRDR